MSNPKKQSTEAAVRRSVGEADGSSLRKRRSASCSKGFEASRALPTYVAEKASPRISTTAGARIFSKRARSSWPETRFESRSDRTRVGRLSLGMGPAWPPGRLPKEDPCGSTGGQGGDHR